MYFSARAEGRISYGHLGCTNSCFNTVLWLCNARSVINKLQHLKLSKFLGRKSRNVTATTFWVSAGWRADKNFYIISWPCSSLQTVMALRSTNMKNVSKNNNKVTASECKRLLCKCTLTMPKCVLSIHWMLWNSTLLRDIKAIHTWCSLQSNTPWSNLVKMFNSTFKLKNLKYY